MLGKLLKHEFIATSKYFIPLFLTALILTPLTRLATNLSFLQNGVLQVIPITFSILYVIALIFMGAIAFVIITYRFYKNMVTEEGYLTHTLPVKASSHIWTKITASCIWLFLSILVTLTSIFVFFITPERWNSLCNDFSTLFQDFSTIPNSGFKTNFILFLVELFFIVFVACIVSILFIYASISIGQVLIKSHRVLGSFVAAIIMYIITSIFSLIACIPFFLSFSKKAYTIARTIDETTITTHSSQIEVEFEQSLELFKLMTHNLLPFLLLGSILLSIVYFIISNYIMKKHLNLE